MDLEGEAPTTEVAESTAETKETKSTESKEKPTVGITESPEFRTALDKALGKSTESLNKQVTLSKQGETAAKAETKAANASVAVIEGEVKDLQVALDDLVSKQFADDDEGRKAYIDRRAIADERKEAAKKLAEAEGKLFEAGQKEQKLGMAIKAKAVMEETGVPLEEIENCTTEADIEVKGLRYKMAKESEKVEPEKKEPKKFDSLTSTGSGEDLSQLTPIERAGKELEISRKRTAQRRAGQDPDYQP